MVEKETDQTSTLTAVTKPTEVIQQPNKKFILYTTFGIILVSLLISTGIFAYQNFLLKKQIIQLQSNPTPTPSLKQSPSPSLIPTLKAEPSIIPRKKEKYVIKYEVVTNNNFSWLDKISWLEFSDNDGRHSNNQTPPSPWIYEFTTENQNLELYLYAKAMPCDGPCPNFKSSITAKIYIDGKEKLSKTSEKRVVLKTQLASIAQ